MEYERRLGIIIFEHLSVILLCHTLNCLCVDTCEDTSCKVSPEWHKVYHRALCSNSHKVLSDLCKMLVSKQFVYGNVVVSIAEMSSLTRFLACSGRTSNGSHVDFVLDQVRCRERKSSKLDGCCKTSGICNIVRFADILTGTLAKAIHEITSCIISIKSEVVAKVYDSALRLDVMRVNKLS